jgi:hypothetical protein
LSDSRAPQRGGVAGFETVWKSIASALKVKRHANGIGNPAWQSSRYQ